MSRRLKVKDRAHWVRSSAPVILYRPIDFFQLTFKTEINSVWWNILASAPPDIQQSLDRGRQALLGSLSSDLIELHNDVRSLILALTYDYPCRFSAHRFVDNCDLLFDAIICLELNDFKVTPGFLARHIVPPIAAGESNEEAIALTEIGKSHLDLIKQVIHSVNSGFADGTEGAYITRRVSAVEHTRAILGKAGLAS